MQWAASFGQRTRESGTNIGSMSTSIASTAEETQPAESPSVLPPPSPTRSTVSEESLSTSAQQSGINVPPSPVELISAHDDLLQCADNTAVDDVSSAANVIEQSQAILQESGLPIDKISPLSSQEVSLASLHHQKLLSDEQSNNDAEAEDEEINDVAQHTIADSGEGRASASKCITTYSRYYCMYSARRTSCLYARARASRHILYRAVDQLSSRADNH